MAYFKDKNDGVYISDIASAGWMEITKDEYDVLNPTQQPTLAERKAAKQREIDALEANQFMTRGEREGWLAMILAQATAQAVAEPTLYLANPFYKKLKDVNTQVTALRAELKAIV